MDIVDEQYPAINFYYDIKTGKGVRSVGSHYTDDINQISQVAIRPFQANADMFYYWHTHMNPDDFEEPNPTLYIGKFKK